MVKHFVKVAAKGGRVVTFVASIEERQVDPTKRRVTRALLLIPEKEEDPPGLMLDSEVKEGTWPGSFSNANSPPWVMRMVAEDDGSGKRETEAGNGLKSGINGQSNDFSPNGAHLSVG